MSMSVQKFVYVSSVPNRNRLWICDFSLLERFAIEKKPRKTMSITLMFIIRTVPFFFLAVDGFVFPSWSQGNVYQKKQLQIRPRQSLPPLHMNLFEDFGKMLKRFTTTANASHILIKVNRQNQLNLTLRTFLK